MRYRISGKIGEGETGEVFLAHDPSLDRPVALRLLAKKHSLHEAKSAAALDHPYICKIYEVGEDEENLFIAMEYVRGDTLERRLAREALPLAEAIRIASEIAEALETAHVQGIAHRDLKTSNIMLTEGGHVKVMDFGLAKTEDHDPRSDILSFGIVLDEMVAGNATEPLERVIRKMRAKNPDERFQRVHDVRTDLAGVVAPTPAVRTKAPATIAFVALTVVGAWFLFDALMRRQPPSIAVLPLSNISDDPLESDYIAEGISQAVITRLVQAGLQVTPWQTARRYGHTGEPPEAVARELNTDTVLVGTFHLAGERILASLSLVDADSGMLSWAEEFEAPYQDIFQMQRQIAVRAATSLKRSLTGDEEAALTTPESRSVDAYDFYLQASYLLEDGTRESTEIAFEYFDRALELDPSLADAHVGRGVVHHDRYYFGWGGLENLEKAEASFERALELNPSSLRARRGLLNVHFQKGNAEACLIEGDEAARVGQPRDVETLLTRALAYHFGGLSHRALPLFHEALKIDPVNQEAQWRLATHNSFVGSSELGIEATNAYVQRFGDDPEIHLYVAIAHHRLGNVEQAREHYENAIGLGTDQASTIALTLDRVPEAAVFGGLLYEQLGEHERAAQMWQLGIDVLAPRLEEFPDNGKLALTLASFYGLLGERDSMIAAEKRALRGTEAANWASHLLAVVHATRGETDQAVDLLQRSLRHGFVHETWEVFLQLADNPLQELQPFNRFVEAYRAEMQRLEETY